MKKSMKKKIATLCLSFGLLIGALGLVKGIYAVTPGFNPYVPTFTNFRLINMN